MKDKISEMYVTVPVRITFDEWCFGHPIHEIEMAIQAVWAPAPRTIKDWVQYYHTQVTERIQIDDEIVYERASQEATEELLDEFKGVKPILKELKKL